MLRKVKIEEAIGVPICHDMTKVVPGEFKGVAFKKGHIITAEDIPKLKAIGKESIYVGEMPQGYVHEEECAIRIADAICSREKFDISGVSQGKINISSKVDGVFSVDTEKLYELNKIEHVAICTIYDKIPVWKGNIVASERIIPLYTREENIHKVEKACHGVRLLDIKTFLKHNIHLIITGNEVFKGTIKDRFYEALEPKVRVYGSEITKVVKTPDDKDWIKKEIESSLNEGADMIMCTGGMSVDEDDLTPVAMKEVIDRLVVHGTPVQPGNMFLLGYSGSVPIIGLPAAVMFYPNTIFDIVFPMLVSKMSISSDFFIKMSLGGLCRFCSDCHYPNCTFGKGR